MGSNSDFPITQPWISTPLKESLSVSRAAGCKVYLKLENLQPSGSFKSRGIGHLILHHIKAHRESGSSKPLHFFSSSGGNAGLACVTAATALGYKSSVVVPNSTKPYTIAKLRSAGAAQVLQEGASWVDADRYLRKVVIPQAVARGEQGVYVPPFDDPLIWEGHSGMVEEIAAQMPMGKRPDAIICAVGGGGLLCGVMEGIERVGWGDAVKVLAMETIGADSLNQSVKAGELVTLPGITSIATTLGAVRVAEEAFRHGQKKNVVSIALNDAEAAMGCWRIADDERLLVEVSCGISVAPCYNGLLKKLIPSFGPQSNVVVILCGGSHVTPEMIVGFRETYATQLPNGN